MAKTSKKDCVHNTANVITLETNCYVQNSLLKGVLLNVGHGVKLNPKPYLSDHKPLLQEFLLKHPDARLQDLCRFIQRSIGIKVDTPYVSRVVKYLGLPYKKRGNQGRLAKQANNQLLF